MSFRVGPAGAGAVVGRGMGGSAGADVFFGDESCAGGDQGREGRALVRLLKDSVLDSLMDSLDGGSGSGLDSVERAV